jgi:hypothetical protein
MGHHSKAKQDKSEINQCNIYKKIRTKTKKLAFFNEVSRKPGNYVAYVVAPKMN